MKHCSLCYWIYCLNRNRRAFFVNFNYCINLRSNEYCTVSKRKYFFGLCVNHLSMDWLALSPTRYVVNVVSKLNVKIHNFINWLVRNSVDRKNRGPAEGRTLLKDQSASIKMARFIQFLLLIELISIIPSMQSARHGFDPELLHADKELPLNQAEVIEPEAFSAFVRSRRDVTASSSDSTKSSSASATTKQPMVPQSTTNARPNVTMQTENNITTMVGVISIGSMQWMI